MAIGFFNDSNLALKKRLGADFPQPPAPGPWPPSCPILGAWLCELKGAMPHPSRGSGGDMKKVSFSIQLFVCLIVFAATVCAANDGTIHGRITEVRGYLMHDLTVTARNNQSGQEFQTRTDAQGFFLFEHLEPGSYALRSACPNIQEISGHAQVV